jgi:cytidine deaminase
MYNKLLSLHYKQFSSFSELSEQDQHLLMKAIETSESAYAPYSSFKVGAAVLLDNQVIITGSNQENAAYPSGLCAERVALFAASSRYPDISVVALAIVASSDNFTVNEAVSPCGACRQVIAEYEIRQSKPIKVIFSTKEGNGILTEGVDSLLPFKFSKKDLNL